ncbi:SDR family oxidoreductase [Ornithinimicrobium avium]|uniref:SDR family NAD(P)-dependent oxidoreductase n=1 Tax=Ornithinimicrobium avium TaxID=2283195 RepID=A0A345NJF4_9MICO|nr:SDR family oxidoreductase [Ornithinimicrobium avium]AXH95162.1 SDR family NAD(P)-dependent oxidoreductase [Ornithinimicrobium avium]
MDLGLAGRAYLLTGASRGLGLATAEHLVRDGADVLVSSRSEEHVLAAARQLSDSGPGTAEGLTADLADPDAADRLLDAADEHFGRLDGVVISVGGPPGGSTNTVTDEQWRDAFESVFLGAVRLARTALEQARAPIAVTFVLSTSVRAPIAGLAISNGLRPGLAMVAKTMADEHGPHGHRVNAVLPGRFETDRVRELESAAEDPVALRERIVAGIPLRRYGQPEEFGAVAAFVTSPMASYLTGSVVTVDGGSTRAP